MESPDSGLADRAAAVDCDDLTGYIARIAKQVQDASGYVVRLAGTLQWNLAKDRLLCRVAHTVLRPEYRAGRDAIDTNFWREIFCERPCQHRQASLGGTVDRVVAQRSLRMNIYDVDDAAIALRQFRRGRLGKEQRCFEIAAHKVFPVRLCNAADRRGVEGRRIVDEAVESTVPGTYTAY